MADYSLIDEYLGQLRQETRWLRDAEEIAEEVEDHLLEAVDRRTGRGVDGVTAQKRALTEFGDPEIVGRAFASSRTGGAAMPTQFTRRAGYALIISAFLLVADVVIFVAANGTSFAWMTGVFVFLAALLFAAIGILGVKRRHGGSLGLPATIGFWLFLVAGATFIPANAYVIPFEVPLAAFAVASVLVGTVVTRSDIAPRTTGVLIAVGATALFGGVWLEESLNLDVADVVFFSAMLVFAFGEAVLGRWLATEAVDKSEPLVTA